MRRDRSQCPRSTGHASSPSRENVRTIEGATGAVSLGVSDTHASQSGMSCRMGEPIAIVAMQGTTGPVAEAKQPPV